MSILKLHDYLTSPQDRNGTNDVAAPLNQFFADLLTSARAGLGAEADLGSGTYRCDSVVHIGTPPGDGAGFKGRIIGDGPELCQFTTGRVGANDRILQVNDMWAGRLEGFSVRGPGRGKARGLVLAARHVDMGTNNVRLEHVMASDLNYGIQVGDDTTPLGAAAELVFENCIAQRCSRGFAMGQWNTLDLIYIRCGAGDCGTGWSTSFPQGSAGQVMWYGGASYKNDTDFSLYGYHFILDDFRTEPLGKMTPRIVGGFSGNGMLHIRQFLVSANYGVPVALTLNGGALKVEQSYFNGALESTGQLTSAHVSQCGFFIQDGSSPIKFTNTPRLRLMDNWMANQAAGGIPTTWLANGGWGGSVGPKGDKGDPGEQGPPGPAGVSGTLVMRLEP